MGNYELGRMLRALAEAGPRSKLIVLHPPRLTEAITSSSKPPYEALAADLAKLPRLREVRVRARVCTCGWFKCTSSG
jgi:hypothetical protein